MKKIVIFDLGTSSLKVSIFGEELISEESFSYPTYTKDGKIEQYTKDWEKAFKKGIKWLMERCKWEEVEAFSFTGQMEDLIIGEEIILYSDTRGKEAVPIINNHFGKENLYEILGNYIDPMMPLTKLYLLRDTISKHNKLILGGKDYLIHLLTGKYVTDPTNASTTGLYNIREKKWEKRLLDFIGITEDMLPTIEPPDSIVGETGLVTKKMFGIPEGIKIVNGMGDAGASYLGTKIQDACASLYLGTTGWISITRKDLPEDGIPGIFTLDFIDGEYLFIGAPLNVGKVYSFLKDLFSDVNISSYRIKNLPIFLPYLSGERSPFTDPYALSSWIGINESTKREELIFSAMEGVSFSMYHTAEVLLRENMPKTLILTGGVSKNALWSKLFANIFGSIVYIPEIGGSPSLGAYILAKRALGLSDDIEIKIDKQFEPNTGFMAFHKNRYKIYKELYPLLKDTYYKLKRG